MLTLSLVSQSKHRDPRGSETEGTAFLKPVEGDWRFSKKPTISNSICNDFWALQLDVHYLLTFFLFSNQLAQEKFGLEFFRKDLD